LEAGDLLAKQLFVNAKPRKGKEMQLGPKRLLVQASQLKWYVVCDSHAYLAFGPFGYETHILKVYSSWVSEFGSVFF